MVLERFMSPFSMMNPTSFQLLNSVPTKDLIGGLRGAILGDMNPRYQEQNRKNITERASEPVFKILGFHTLGRSARGRLEPVWSS